MKNKVLFLGVNNGTEEMMKIAKDNGFHTIVTDDVPIEKSPVKKMADEAWMISNRDVDSLEKKMLEDGIKSVLAGCSEAALDVAVELADRLNLDFYASKEAWKIARNKILFKEKCREYGISTPREYNIGDEIDKFPVIIKPSDACACKGISICHSADQLDAAKKYALDNSQNGEIIIEEFIEGIEVVVFYYVKDGKANFLRADSVYGNEDNKILIIITDKKMESEYREKVDIHVKDMLENNGFKEGPVFIQMMYKDNEFYSFEMGYRITGNYNSVCTQHLYGLDEIKLITEYSLGIQSDFKIMSQNNKYNVLYQIWNAGGEISKIRGWDAVQELPGVYWAKNVKKQGDVIEADGTMRQINSFIAIEADSLYDIKKIVNTINEIFNVYDCNGNQMLIKYAFENFSD